MNIRPIQKRGLEKYHHISGGQFPTKSPENTSYFSADEATTTRVEKCYEGGINRRADDSTIKMGITSSTEPNSLLLISF